MDRGITSKHQKLCLSSGLPWIQCSSLGSPGWSETCQPLPCLLLCQAVLAHPAPGDPQQELLRVLHTFLCLVKPREGFEGQVTDCELLVAPEEKQRVKELEVAFIAAPL